MLLNLNKFLGQNYYIPNHLLPEEVGQSSINTYIEDGRLVPMKSETAYDPSKTFTNTSKTIYLHKDINNDVEKWLEFTDFTNVVRHPTGNDIYQRVYYVKDGKLKFKAYSDAYEYDTLLPKINPQNQLTITNNAVGSIRRFIGYTLVNTFGEETSLSLAESGSGNYVFGNYFVTDLQSSSTLTITWTAASIVPAGGAYNSTITKIRFYMTSTDSTTDDYKFVGETTIAAQTFTITEAGTDTPLKENITTPVKVTYDDAIVFVGVCKTVFGSIIAFDKSNIYISDQYKPFSFNASNVYSIESAITGAYPYGNNIIAFTSTIPYVLSGNTPANMYIEKAEKARSVKNINCVVNTDDFVVFPTDEGIYIVGTGIFKLATENMISKQNWDLITNKGAYLYSATHYKDLYLLNLTSGKTLVFDFKRGHFFELDYDIQYSFYDSIKQNLFIFRPTVSLTQLYTFNTNTTYLTATHKSKRYIFNKPYSLKYLRVLADTYSSNTHVHVYLDGTLRATIVCDTDSICKLPSFATRECYVEVSTDVPLRSVLLSNDIKEIQAI